MWVQKVPGGGVDAIAYAPDGRTLYTRDRGHTLTAWDTATRVGRRLFSRAHARMIYPLADGRIVGVGPGIVAWNGAESERAFGELPQGWPSDSAHVTPDGRVFFLDASSTRITGLDLDTGAPLPPRTVPYAPGPIHRFALAPNEKTIAISFRQSVVTAVYEWTDGPELRNPVTLDRAWDLRFSPDGRVLAASRSGPPRVTFWEVPSARPEGVTATWKPRVENVPCWISDGAFAINPVLPVFVAINGGSLTLFSLETGAAIRSLDFELGTRTRCVCFSPDGLTCAAGGSNKRFVVFDVDL